MTILLAAISVATIISTYTVFNHTWDEPAHIACGMQLMDSGAYSYDLRHPPLARIMSAVGPYVKGLRSQGMRDFWPEGNAILFSDGHYWQNIGLARAGILPFFLLSVAVVYLWARRWFDEVTGAAAVFFYVTLPPILGNAGLATTDMACAATLSLALYVFLRWLEGPSPRRSVLLGICLGLAFLTKFSNFAFLGVCCTFALAWTFATGVRNWQSMFSRRAVLQLGVVLIVTFGTMWGGYRFSLNSWSDERGSHQSIDRVIKGPGILHSAAYALVEAPLPLAEMYKGLKLTKEHNRIGHDSYLFGAYRKHGWWYFFPVVLAIKTPLPGLLLGAAGIVLLLLTRRQPYQRTLTGLFPLLILSVCIPSHIDLGVRHVLPIYTFSSLAAGHLATTCFRQGSRLLSVAILVASACALIVAFLSYPDYFAYTNALAGSHPEKVVCESDLDWGQDLNRLSKRLVDLRVTDLGVSYNGSFPLDRANLPRFVTLDPLRPRKGYVAISVYKLCLGYAKDGSFAWLKTQTPIERVGKSILLYRIER